MPKKTITYLGFSASVLALAYIALVGVTVCFAALTTERAAQARVLEAEVSLLETRYYDALSDLSTEDVVAQGYVVPVDVRYVGIEDAPSLTRADR